MNQTTNDQKLAERAISDAVVAMTWQHRKYMRIESLIIKLSLIVWSGTFGDDENKSWVVSAIKQVAQQPMDFFVEELVGSADSFAKEAACSQFGLELRAYQLSWPAKNVSRHSGTLVITANSGSVVEELPFTFDLDSP